MSVTMDQVFAALAPDEPDYDRAASELGPEALPHLHQAILTGDPELASKATYLAGRIATEEATEVLQEAARSDTAIVRVAAAETANNLPAQEANDTLIRLVEDNDLGVRRIALESAVDVEATEELRARVAQMSERDPLPQLREQATRTLDQLSS